MTFKLTGMASLAMAAALQVSVAHGQTVPADWAQLPTAEQVGAAYPALATSLQIEGRALLACAINTQGVLRDCAVESETPEGLGFGEGALRIAPYFRLHPSVVNGRAVADDRVGIPVAFRLPKTTIPA
ncbi:MAG: TonB family protein, partial [Phenylobacterium sp.]|nr:TonB family protein [Phenylobacterium sp.]